MPSTPDWTQAYISFWPIPPQNTVPFPPWFTFWNPMAQSSSSFLQKLIVSGWKCTSYGTWIKRNRNLSLTEFSNPLGTNQPFGCHDSCSEIWCPVKAGKMDRNGKYHDWEKEKKLFKWLMLHVSTKVEGEKLLLSLHRPFDTQINEAKNNAESRHVRKTRCLQDPEAFNFE